MTHEWASAFHEVFTIIGAGCVGYWITLGFEWVAELFPIRDRHIPTRHHKGE